MALKNKLVKKRSSNQNYARRASRISVGTTMLKLNDSENSAEDIKQFASNVTMHGVYHIFADNYSPTRSSFG